LTREPFYASCFKSRESGKSNFGSAWGRITRKRCKR
jgi:hypothetical protein